MGEDDIDSHYIPNVNEVIINRYRIKKKLGKGTFGTVFAAVDLETKRPVALKIIRSIPKYTEAGQRELSFIYEIQNSSEAGRKNCIEVLASFMFLSHLVIVMPLYGISLIDYLRQNNYKGYNLEWTRELAKEFISGVCTLHNLGIIHSDIKPENIVSLSDAIAQPVRDRIFVYPPGANLVLIDMGSALHVNEPKPRLVCTREYRPPEVIIETAFDEKIDIWSIGCVLYEISSGKTLFRTHNSLVHLCMMEKLLGPMPINVAQKIVNFVDYYEDNGWEFPDEVENEEIRAFQTMPTFTQIANQFEYSFVHLLKWILQWDPELRPTCEEILEHPFLMEPSKESKQTQASSVMNELIKNLVNGEISLDDFIKWYKSENE